MARTNPANVGEIEDASGDESASEEKFVARAETEDGEGVADLKAEDAAEAPADGAALFATGGAACSDKAFGMATDSMLGGEPPGWMDASGSPMGRAFAGRRLWRQGVQNKEDRI